MTTSATPRIPNLPEDQWTPEVQEIFPMMVPPGSDAKGSEFNAVLLLAHNPRLAKAWFTFNGGLSRTWVLPKRLQEIAVLRVAWNLKSEYEWVQHMFIGQAHGLDMSHVRAIQRGADDPLWSDLERHIVRAADQGCSQTPIDEETWAGLTRELDEAQMLELMFCIGAYAMMAWIFNSTGLQLEERFVPIAQTMPRIEDREQK